MFEADPTPLFKSKAGRELRLDSKITAPLTERALRMQEEFRYMLEIFLILFSLNEISRSHFQEISMSVGTH